MDSHSDHAMSILGVALDDARAGRHTPSPVHLLGVCFRDLEEANAGFACELGASVVDVRVWAARSLPLDPWYQPLEEEVAGGHRFVPVSLEWRRRQAEASERLADIVEGARQLLGEDAASLALACQTILLLLDDGDVGECLDDIGVSVDRLKVAMQGGVLNI